MTEGIVFLSLEDVITIHEDTMETEGGLSGIRDVRLLDSAVMMAQQSFGGEMLHPDLASMAAAYLFHICKNHPFNDGNKRVAAASSLVFLLGNGVEALPPPMPLRDITLQVAAGTTSKETLIEWMREVLAV